MWPAGETQIQGDHSLSCLLHVWRGGRGMGSWRTWPPPATTDAVLRAVPRA